MAIDDWRKKTPNTVRTLKIQGDTTYAQHFMGEVDLLIYQTRNRMELGNLKQLRAQRTFNDGTEITVTSIFGHDIVDVDVTRAISVIEVTCSITLFDIPETVVPMKYPGEIHEGEVEGVDYIKTYYAVDVSRCGDCDIPDFSVCDTTELADNEALCKPFYFPNASVEGTIEDADNHCLQSTSHCQAEIISLGIDGGGTYFLWKAYTEWPPDDGIGLGYMLLKGFIKRIGQPDELCVSESVVKVDCCEKNEDAYKAVHTEDWGDLDIEYTSLVMGCDEEQELTAKYGCPPFTWTLVSGGGILTPAEDGLSAIYASPETNPDCVSNPTITLQDRCENTKELQLAVNCGDPAWTAFKYVDYIECRGCAKYVVGTCNMKLIGRVQNYDCDGNLKDTQYDSSGDEFAPKPTTFSCSDPNVAEYLNCGSPDCWEFRSTCGDCIEYWLTWWFGYGSGWHDVRSQAQKDAACCPINPETGLPA